jgi:hypothetical protein
MKMVLGYNFPDDATDEEIQTALKSIRGSAPETKPIAAVPEAAQPMSGGEYAKGLARSFGSGLTFGFGDELTALARSKLGGEDYDKALQEERDSLKRFRDQYPVAALGSEVVGSLPTLLVPGLGEAKGLQFASKIGKVAEPYIQAGIIGTKQGVIGGIGGAEGDISNRIVGGLEGGATGAALGPLMTGAGKIAAPVVKGLAERVAPGVFSEGVAKQKVLQDLQRSNLTPEQAQAKFEYMQSTGASPNYFDVSPSLTSRAEAIAQRPGAAGEALTQEVIDRQQGQRGRIMEQAKERLDSSQPYFDTVDNAVEALRTKADPLYKEAYKAKLPPEAQYQLQTVMDDVKAAFPEAVKDAERLFLAERRKNFKETGTAALANQNFAGLPQIRQYDYIMRGLGQVIDGQTDIAGKVTQLGRGAKMMKDDIANVLDTHVPEFAAARAQYAGDMEVKNALTSARKEFMTADPEELKLAWKGMSDAEKEAYRAGAIKAMRDKLFGSADNTDATKRIGQAIQDRRDALNIIMPEQMSGQLFQAYLETEAKLAANAQRIKGGSPTARRLEGLKDLDSAPDMTALGVAKDVATGKPASALNRVFNFLAQNPAIPEKRANAIGEMLRSGTPEEVDRVTKSLSAYAEDQAAKAAKQRALSIAGTKVSTKTMGGRMPEQEPYQMPPLTIRRGP